MAAVRTMPWIAILAIIAVVQFIRDAPVDGVVFAVLAVLLVLDAVGVLPDPPTLRAPLAALLAAGVVAAGVLVLAPRHGVVAGVVVALIGAAALAVTWPGGRTRDARPAAARVRRGGILWAVVAVALCLWELSSFLLGRGDEAGKLDHPAVSDLLDPVVDEWWGHAAFVVLWLAAGAGLLRAAGIGARR